MNNYVVLNVHIQASPGAEDELAQHLSALVGPTRAEPGCVSYELFRDPEQPAKFMFQEVFRDQAALDAHLAMDYFQQFVKFREASKPDPVQSAVVTRWRNIS
jgi:quinol monooxygenase YgiN